MADGKSKASKISLYIGIAVGIITIAGGSFAFYSNFLKQSLDTDEFVKSKLALANEYFQNGRFQETANIADQILMIKQDRDALLLRGHAYKEIGQYDNAINSYKEILDKVHKNDEVAMQSIGNIYMNLHDYSTAVEWFNKAIKTNDLAPYPYIRKADAMYEQGYCTDALILYDTVINSEKKFEHGDNKEHNLEIANEGKSLTLKRQQDVTCDS